MKVTKLDTSGAYLVNSNNPGPKVVVFGSIHGNEPCGNWAINMLLDEINNNHVIIEKGQLTLVIANEEGLKINKRGLTHNLNRLFKDLPQQEDSYETRRAQELIPFLKSADYFLDLHSTARITPHFVTCQEQLKDEAVKYGVPNIVTGWEKFNSVSGDTEAFAIRYGATAFTIENGQHYEPDTIENAYNNLLRFLNYAGISNSIVPKYEAPKIYDLKHVELKKSENTSYSRQFSNFEFIEKGATIITVNNNEVRAEKDSYIVMPGDIKNSRIGEEIYFLADLTI